MPTDPEAERVSLAPLSPEDALRALLRVEPDEPDPEGEANDEVLAD